MSPCHFILSAASSVSLLLGLALAVPTNQLGVLSRRQDPVTHTVLATVLQTSTITTFTTLAPSSDLPSPSASSQAPSPTISSSIVASFSRSPPSPSDTTIPSTTSSASSTITSDVSPSTISSPDISVTQSQSTTDALDTASSSYTATSTSDTLVTPTPTSSDAIPSPTTPSSDPSSSDPTSTSDPSSDPSPTESGSPLNNAIGRYRNTKPQMMVYYPEWAASYYPPEKIDFDRIDWVDFAFAVPDKSLKLGWDGSDSAANSLQRLVSVAHAAGKKVKLSVGGWTGSKYFSYAVSNPTRRQTLISNIVSFYHQYNVDGIDIDWEYPGQQGNEGNIVNPNDSARYLAFLQGLRAALPVEAKVTAAVMTVPFVDAQGNPMRDVSAFAKVLDWVLLMNYDSWGSSPNPGPNAPLNDACHNSTQPTANAQAAVKAWTSAGFPASQLVLGVPSYGYISRSTARTLHTRRRRSLPLLSPSQMKRQLLGLDLGFNSSSVADSDSGGATTKEMDIPEMVNPLQETLNWGNLHSEAYQNNVVVATNGDGGSDNGQIQFRDLLGQAILKYSSSSSSSSSSSDTLSSNGYSIPNHFRGTNAFTRYWDSCSNTPFLRSEKAGQVISYDDPQSLELKGMLVKQFGLGGVNMFDVSGETDHWDLVDAVRRGLGLVEV